MSSSKIITELMRQKQLLQIEYEEEKASFSQTAQKRGIERLKEAGDAWLDIRIGRSYYNSLNRRVVEIYKTEEEKDEDNNFEPGRPVIFFSFATDFDNSFKIYFKGEVSYVDSDRMVVCIPEETDLSSFSSLRHSGIMISFDETSYRAMFDAIDAVLSAKGRLGELRDLVYSGKEAGEYKLPFQSFPYLNESQEKAVNKVLAAKDFAILHGPPGTGKTTTMVEAIYETLRKEPQVLVCAQSNAAVDWIAEKLSVRGLNVLRIGNPSRVNDKILSFTYERRFESHPAYSDLWSLRKTIRQLYKNKNQTESFHQKIDRLKSRATELEIRINNDIFNSAHVIASTLVGSGHRVLSGMKFSTLFIDEAAQSLEAASWIAIRKAGRVIFAGDHYQLPPTVKSQKALKEGLGRSLMEVIAERHPSSVSLLSLQYRMHEDIMAFPNKWFYGGKMNAASEVRFRSILDFDTPIEWIDTSAIEEEESATEGREDNENKFREQLTGSFGKVNKAEGVATLEAVKKYIERIGLNRFIEERLDIGIISPYRAQVVFLRRLIRKDVFFKPLRKQISINTVDGFQGQERDIMVISMVRSNESGNIGFLRELRRMNVAMTRARMKLLIIGHVPTLSKTRFYKELISYIDQLK